MSRKMKNKDTTIGKTSEKMTSSNEKMTSDMTDMLPTARSPWNDKRERRDGPGGN